jgi:hypothetical protein
LASENSGLAGQRSLPHNWQVEGWKGDQSTIVSSSSSSSSSSIIIMIVIYDSGY